MIFSVLRPFFPRFKGDVAHVSPCRTFEQIAYVRYLYVAGHQLSFFLELQKETKKIETCLPAAVKTREKEYNVQRV